MAVILGLLIGVPVGVWVYDKTMQRTGHNTRTSVIAGAVVGGIAFIISVTAYLLLDSAIS